MEGWQGSFMDSLGTTGVTMDFGRGQYPTSTYYDVLSAYVVIYIVAGACMLVAQSLAANAYVLNQKTLLL